MLPASCWFVFSLPFGPEVGDDIKKILLGELLNCHVASDVSKQNMQPVVSDEILVGALDLRSRA
jgi:hypothetical protein